MITATLQKEHLRLLFDRVKAHFRIIGPKVSSRVVTLGELTDFDEMPTGLRDRHRPGSYELAPETEGLFLPFSVGPDSLKRFFHPPVREVYTYKKTRGRIQVRPIPPSDEAGPVAFFGMRACDLASLALLDKVFLHGRFKDTRYEARKRNTFLVAVNCIHPGDHCFCHSMGTGPEARSGFDIALTELDECFFVELATSAARSLCNDLPLREADQKEGMEKAAKVEQCARMMKKSVPVKDLPRLITNNLEHPRWSETAVRCLGCGNCTQVCPTCFCTTAEDVVPLACLSKKTADLCGSRRRTWDSCFSINFARVHGGNFRASRRARFRHWVAHKMAYWIHQFGTPGCVGCGRCITWCPVGIDLTQELEALAPTRSVT